MNGKRHGCREDAGAPLRVRKGFISTRQGQVHFRKCGTGPGVALLHDSPRSSRLHLDTMQALAHRYTVHALDTPGYGLSDPLPIADPSIGDFAHALEEALDALGLGAAPLYATHTSAKIAIEHAALTNKPRKLVLDGLSIPDKLADADFIQAYMRPFQVDPTGAYLAAEWQRTRDMLRWFPWFAPSAATRMAMDRPDNDWIERYTIDLFSAASHYSDAYAAAMRYDPAPALRRVSVPVLVGARSDDVLYGHLDKVPVGDPPALSVARLGADRRAWLQWIEQSLDCPDTLEPMDEPLAAQDGALDYVDCDHGQILIRQAGRRGPVPVLILEAPFPYAAFGWQAGLADRRRCVIPELPGYGESDPLAPGADMGDLVRAMQRVIAHLGGTVDLIGIGHATSLALALGNADSGVRRIVLDGAPGSDADASGLCPHFPFGSGGSHIHESFHMIRDWQVQYPWYSPAASARRRTEPALDGDRLHACLLGMLKQPAHYGDALTLCMAAPEPQPRVESRGSDMLVFTLESDPYYARAEDLAARLPGCIRQERPLDLGLTADRAGRFLASDA